MSFIDKISQAEKVGQMQHPEYALKSASLVELSTCTPYTMSFIDKISQAEKVGQIQHPDIMQSSQHPKVTMCFKFDTCNTISMFINELP
jgi:hypothetical protein